MTYDPRGPARRTQPAPLAPPGAPAHEQRIAQALRRLRVRDMETLDSLGRTRSFARTAEAASITQPALSKWLRELEDALGLPLFERTSRRVAPTVYGDALLECIGRVLTDMRGVAPAFDALRTGTGRPVSIGLLPNMAPQLIPGALAWLQEAGRPVQLNVREDTLDRMLAQAQRHELDLLVCRLDASALSAGLDVAPLYRDDMIVVCGPRHPLLRRARIGWRDAAAFPWIAPPLGSPARTALDAEFANAGLPPPPVRMESVSWQTNRVVAEQSPCLFVQSARAFELAVRSGERVGRLPLKLSTMPETVGALYAAPAGVSVTAAIDALKAVTRTEPGAAA
ncbi:LysR family transcriptional regulator [Burkholderia lata]|uniref:LysR substrate-binding domain-containing protein n=1 Tax=Burkholderia lata (strain ATCC 17760 / DSM 23089 / LMG 22485 / NCIMB 9086 / R18194 / 383) TaxID=482957 RepID=UPI000841D390|nr:LysR substrate-binding domain-containing protein [Burkholderia lata]AOJ43437.1 LysR family transcriptional regulator [Burkholderia lata]